MEGFRSWVPMMVGQAGPTAAGRACCWSRHAGEPEPTEPVGEEKVVRKGMEKMQLFVKQFAKEFLRGCSEWMKGLQFWFAFFS